MQVCHLAQVLAWLQNKFVSAREPCVRDFRLRPDLEQAMGYLKTTVNDELSKVEGGHYGDLQRFATSSLGKCLANAGAWLEEVQMTVPKLSRFIVDKLVSSCTTLATEVEKYVPNYSHIATEDRVNMTLAKRHLLGWSFRTQLNDKTILLFHSLADVSRFHTSLGLSPIMSEDLQWKDAVDSSTALFRLAKQAISTIAAVNVLCELSGREQLDNASAILTTGAKEIPNSLVTKLQQLVGDIVPKASAPN
jgi:hypothetical protein